MEIYEFSIQSMQNFHIYQSFIFNFGSFVSIKLKKCAIFGSLVPTEKNHKIYPEENEVIFLWHIVVMEPYNIIENSFSSSLNQLYIIQMFFLYGETNFPKEMIFLLQFVLIYDHFFTHIAKTLCLEFYSLDTASIAVDSSV